jgi:ribosome-associated protein
MKLIKEEYREKSGQELARICASIALDGQAEELLILDVRGLSTFADYFVIMNGRSTRHVQALAEAIEGQLRSKRVKVSNAEGLTEGVWVLLDFDDVIVHIFYHEQRKFYNLEGLWSDAKRVAAQAV